MNFLKNGDGFAYGFGSTKLSFDDAQDFCADLGAQLAHADTQEQFSIMQQLSVDNEFEFWVGLKIKDYDDGQVACETQSDDPSGCIRKVYWIKNLDTLEFSGATISLDRYSSVQ